MLMNHPHLVVLIRYCDDQFDSESSTATIGVDFKVRHPPLSCPAYAFIHTVLTQPQLKTLSIHNSPYRLNLLDTAGQERFRTLSNSYYRGAHAVILIYDVTNRESFNSMGRWIDEAENNSIDGCVFWLVGTKIDVQGKRVVSAEEGEKLCRMRGLAGFGECSSKTREGVKRLFGSVVEEVVKRPELLKGGGRRAGAVSLGFLCYLFCRRWRGSSSDCADIIL
jgi:Ras-related protein Rab-18